MRIFVIYENMAVTYVKIGIFCLLYYNNFVYHNINMYFGIMFAVIANITLLFMKAKKEIKILWHIEKIKI